MSCHLHIHSCILNLLDILNKDILSSYKAYVRQFKGILSGKIFFES